MLDLKGSALKTILGALGFESPLDLATEMGKREARAFLISRIRIKPTAKAQAKAGITPASGDTVFIRDTLFRVWRTICTFKGGGRVADVIRDAHDDKVIAELAAQIGPETDHVQAVRLVAQSSLELMF